MRLMIARVTDDDLKTEWMDGWKAKAYIIALVLMGGPGENVHLAMFHKGMNVRILDSDKYVTQEVENATHTVH